MDSFFEQYNPYPEEVVPSVEESSPSTEIKPPSPIQGIRILSTSSIGASEPVRPSLQNRNPLMTPGSILSWDNMSKWKSFTEENLNYLKKEYWIFFILVVNFVVSVFSIQFRSFDLTAIVDTLAMLIGIVALSSRNRLYLFFVDFAIALNLVFRSLFLIYFRVTRMVLLSMLCEILLVTLLTQWLVRFRRYPKEELTFYQAMTFSIQRRIPDIVFLLQHPQ